MVRRHGRAGKPSRHGGQSPSLQYPERKDETYLLTGRPLLTQGDDTHEIGPGHVWRNEPGVVHTIEATDDASS